MDHLLINVTVKQNYFNHIQFLDISYYFNVRYANPTNDDRGYVNYDHFTHFDHYDHDVNDDYHNLDDYHSFS